MTIQRLENVGIVIEDLAAATAFFVELGLKVLGEGPVEGGWVDRVVGLESVRVDIAMPSTPPSPGCKPAAWSSLVRWSATKTVTGSATSAARRGSSSCLRSSLAEGSWRLCSSRRS